jgi:DNA topoisomerase-1
MAKSDKPLVIVESPTKARTIEKFLSGKYEVLASYGHIRDLPNNASEIPEAVKKEKWARLGIKVDEDFEPLYIIPDDKKKRVSELKKALKDAPSLFLATDEDREGESISWHLIQALEPKVPVKRMVFHEITKEAIAEALANPRDLDVNLVKAQETRRIIDRLFGYSISPLLWKKVAPRLSAGRVQSVAMRLLVERERLRIKFKLSQYWDLKATFKKLQKGASPDKFEAELTHLNNKRVAIGKDFVPETGLLDPKADVVHLEGPAAEKLRQDLLTETASVTSVEEKPYTTRPYPPFTTSTLQQEGSRKLGFAARRTMQVAQLLYENGIITYMRTDSTTLSQEALDASRSLIAKDFGNEFLHPEPRIYKTKVKNAQEAHEAIRPAGSQFATLQAVRERFGDEAFKLYELIWKRTIASQMSDARGKRMSVDVKVANASFRATGSTIEFPGYLRAYVEGSDDPDQELADRERILPALTVGENLETSALEAISHETQPAARFTEGSLIKELERLGIGRPSTWATIVDVVLSRSYAFKKGTALVPTYLAMVLTQLMEQYFKDIIDYDFTARLEDDLDAISRGEEHNIKYLKHFYFGNGHPGLKKLITQGEELIDPRLINGIPLGTTSDGRKIEIRVGRFGPFLSDGTQRASLADDLCPDELTIEKSLQMLADAAKGPDKLGEHPQTAQNVYLKKGRFGPYIQLGEQTEGGDRPKMASLLPGMEPSTLTLEIALKLLEFPKSIGKHPENNEDIVVQNGRFGPYIKCGAETRSIPAGGPSLLEITVEQAVEILKSPRRRAGRAAAQPKILKELGKHPSTESVIVIKDGRYGPYVTDGTTNASLPRGVQPEALSLPEAVQLIDQRAAMAPKKRGAKKPAAKKPVAAKTVKEPKAPKAAKTPKAAKAPAKSKAKAPKATKPKKKSPAAEPPAA